jgi:sugar/nucleoside kinase (ribokinase family)
MTGSVVVVGDVMTDVIVTPEGPLVRGSDRCATVRSRPGGSGANQAAWLGAMGVPVLFAGRVGQADRLLYEAHFAAAGVRARLGLDAELPSGVLVTLIDPDGERSFLTDRGANLHLCEADLPPSLLDGAGMLVVSGYSLFSPEPRAAVLALVREARTAGVPVAIDPASAGFLEEVTPEAFLDWTSGADLLFTNREEALLLSGEGEWPAAMVRLGSRFGTVVLKRGPDGAAIGGRHGVRHSAPAQAVPVVDTTGAGDAFAAGFIAARLAGADEAGCLARAIAAGALAVQRIGGQPDGGVARDLPQAWRREQ